MNSTLLRILAVCLALGAIITAAIGYRLSTKQATPVAPPPPTTYPQVVAARDIPAGVLLTAQDVRRLTLFKWRYSLESAGFTSRQAAHLLFLKWLYARRGSVRRGAIA